MEPYDSGKKNIFMISANPGVNPKIVRAVHFMKYGSARNVPKRLGTKIFINEILN